MKSLRVKLLLIILLFGSSVPTQICAEVSRSDSWAAWFRTFQMMDILPKFVQAWIPKDRRVQAMFAGTQSRWLNMRTVSQHGFFDEPEMVKFVKDYNQWIEKYKDIINEELGKGITILGLWLGTNWCTNDICYGYQPIGLEEQAVARIVEWLVSMGAHLSKNEVEILNKHGMKGNMTKL